MPHDPAGHGFDPETVRATLSDYLNDLRTSRMPFGRYKGSPIHVLPLEYLLWFKHGRGFPHGRLGELMAFVCQTKADGAEQIFAQLSAGQRPTKHPDPPQP